MSTRGPNARGRATIAAIERLRCHLAESRPVEQITVAAICHVTGVTERVFFNHFPTKEDAFLGLEVPTLDEDWARQYIDDQTIPLLTGAARLVRLPAQTDDEALARRRDLMARNPALLARGHERLSPLRAACRDVVREAVRRRRPHLSAREADAVARVIVAAAAELLPTGGDAPALEALHEVWTIML